MTDTPNAVAVVPSGADAPATVDLFSDARIQLIRQLIAKDAPEHLFVAMLDLARVRGLDPLAKQISLLNFSGQWQITTTIDGYRALAERTEAYAGSDPAVFLEGDRVLGNGKRIPETATVTVWKMVQGQRVPFSATVYWDEYYGGEKNFAWNKMPRTMLAKVAESHALRKAFPTVLSGVYTSEEMDQAGPVIETTGTVSDAPTPSQARQAAPQQPKPTATASASPKPKTAAQSAIDGLHAQGEKLGIDHDGLHAIAVHRFGVSSMTELSGKALYEFRKLLETPEEAHQALYDAVEPTGDEIIDAETGEIIDDGDDPVASFNAAHPVGVQG